MADSDGPQPAPREQHVADDESIPKPPDSLFDNNDQGLVDNPLSHWDYDDIDRKAVRFAHDYRLGHHAQLFVKAAKIVRDPEAYLSVPNLTHDEKEALKNERRNGFWNQPKELRVTIMTLCVAAVVQGWNQTASNGANLQWPQQLTPNLHFQLQNCIPSGPDAWTFAIVNASTYFSASLIGCWLTDPASEYFLGRRAPICLSAVFVLASCIGCALTERVGQLLACRILLGVGMGLKASIVPVFAAEVAPAHIRGSLVMNWQLFDALGIFLGFSANLIVSTVGECAWRWQMASSALPTIILLTLIFVCPESPRFLMKHGRYSAAYRTLILLRGEPILAAKELVYVHFQSEVEKRNLRHVRVDHEAGDGGVMHKSVRGISYWQKLGQLFTQRRIRRAMISAVVCMVGQQLCGVNVLAFYSSTFYCDAGSVASGKLDIRPLWLSWGLGLMNFIFAFPAYRFIDKRGRRWLLLMALPFMALTTLATALAFQIPKGNDAHRPVIALFTYIFIFFYSWSMGPVPFTMSAEVFPLENRVVGMSFAVFTNLFGAGLLTLVVPALTNAIGQTALLLIFAALNVVAFFLVFFFVRETAGAALGGTPGSMTFLSLEELNYIFGVSTKKYIRYQVETVVPWAWQFYIKGKKDPDRPEQLYTWDLNREMRRVEEMERRERGGEEIEMDEVEAERE